MGSFDKLIKPVKKPKAHKYRAQKTLIGGHEFPSKLEASVYSILLLRERAGEVTDIKRQQAVRLKEKCSMCGAGPVVWKVDFSAINSKTGELFFVEAKGEETGDYIKRKKLWKADPPYRLEIWKGSWRNPVLTEVIEPKKGG